MIDLDDIQSLIVRPSRADTVEIHFVRLRSRAGMRLFLERSAGLVTTATEMTEAIAEQTDQPEPPATVTIAVSAAGLDLAGIGPRARSSLPPAFVEGMRAAAHRLGDVGGSDPSQWEPPFDVIPGLDAAARVHAAVIVHGTLSPEQGDAVTEALKSGFDARENSPGDEQGHGHGWIGKRRGGFEPFGFRDNISDPVIEGSGKPVTPGNGVWDAKAGRWRAVRAGEALLGYVDESGALAGHPDAAHIERNGSYLVLRKLEQDVEGFWRECAEWAEDLWPAQPGVDATRAAIGETDDAELAGGAMGSPDGDAPDPRDDPTWPVAVAARTTKAGRVAAQLVGRTWNGAVLRRSEEVDDLDGVPPNDFLYRDRARGDGIAVPPSAHIRRSNPRDGIGAAQQLVPRHLLFRRGIPYFEPEATTADHDDGIEGFASRGLLFMACCADLRRQFEFVQSHWLQDGSRFGLGGERDPLTGTRPRLPPPDEPPPDPSYPDGPGEGDESLEGDDELEAMVSIDHGGARCRRPLSGFVTTRGGEYFLLPSRSALLLLGDPMRRA